ncbi:hypothetical protein [Sorangium sp. So ce1000]|uniref:hypothetical protein n=1 Tax=Sorangium sp. So ce1000 TaxID=3133325 RepID=UPI003F60085A
MRIFLVPRTLPPDIAQRFISALWACGGSGVLLRSLDGGHTWRGEASGTWGTLFEVRGNGGEM